VVGRGIQGVNPPGESLKLVVGQGERRHASRRAFTDQLADLTFRPAPQRAVVDQRRTPVPAARTTFSVAVGTKLLELTHRVRRSALVLPPSRDSGHQRATNCQSPRKPVPHHGEALTYYQRTAASSRVQSRLRVN